MKSFTLPFELLLVLAVSLACFVDVPIVWYIALTIVWIYSISISLVWVINTTEFRFKVVKKMSDSKEAFTLNTLAHYSHFTILVLLIIFHHYYTAIVFTVGVVGLLKMYVDIVHLNKAWQAELEIIMSEPNE